MAVPPIQLQQGTPLGDAYSLINQNFYGTAQNIADIGGKVTSTTVLTFPAQGAGVFNKTVSLVNPGTVLSTPFVTTAATVQPGQISLIVPYVDIYGINDNDQNYRYPYGNLAAAPNNALVPMVNISFTPISGTLGTVTIGGWNIGSTAYTWYFHVMLAYFVNPSSGVFR